MRSKSLCDKKLEFNLKKLAVTFLLCFLGNIWFPSLSISFAPSPCQKLENGFSAETPWIKVVFQNGKITFIKNKRTGEEHTLIESISLPAPVGLGHLGVNPEMAAKWHQPWGTHPVEEYANSGKKNTTFRFPNLHSEFFFEAQKKSCKGTWKGLTNGDAFFPNETLEIAIEIQDKHLRFQARGHSQLPGVFGIQIPLTQLHADHKIYVPSFGGVMYDKKMARGTTSLGGAPFFEAPVIAVEGRQGSMGLWVEDPILNPYFFYLTWTGTTFSVALEHLNLMPYESRTSTVSVWWNLGAFKGGWVDAMTPYKNWYASRYKKAISQKAKVSWAKDIRVIVDEVQDTQATYALLAKTFEPRKVLIHNWQARAPAFDTELPDYTPRAGYVERVQTLKNLGFRTMSYVNTYVVNYNSLVFKRDQIEIHSLDRKNRGFWQYFKTRVGFKYALKGQLLYMDPLSEWWRDYHVNQMVIWNKTTGTDANYEDVAGNAGDFGNGVVDGLAGAQGTEAMMIQLLQENPTVPMASEYCPDAIAFAVYWPLRYQQVWGGPATHQFWIEHQRPVSAYIHGPLHRPWIPTRNTSTRLKEHLMVASSDALGGLAQISATPVSLTAKRGFERHVRYRAKLFSEKNLRPYFEKKKHPLRLVSMYQDDQSNVYSYLVDKHQNQLLGPEGQPLYIRTQGQTQIKSKLKIPGWPAYTEDVTIGLNPKTLYALEPDNSLTPALQLHNLPKGIHISRYFETSEVTFLALDRHTEQAPSKGEVTLSTTVPYISLRINNQEVPIPPFSSDETAQSKQSYDISFPARFLFIKTLPEPFQPNVYIGTGKEIGLYLDRFSGLDYGIPYQTKSQTLKLSGAANATPFLFFNHGKNAEIVLNYLVIVPTADVSLEVYTTEQARVGNGTKGILYINGDVVYVDDQTPMKKPKWFQGMPLEEQYLRPKRHVIRWRIPLGKFKGKPILLTMATDSKGDNNSDYRLWSRPKAIKDKSQEATAEIVHLEYKK
jgi:hypothetical protein